jgi:hypothetical protein
MANRMSFVLIGEECHPTAATSVGAASSRDEWAEAGRSALQRRIVAALIAESEARSLGGLWWKAWGSLLSSKEGRGTGCALRRRPSLPPAPPCFAQPKAGRPRVSPVQTLSRGTLRRPDKYATGPSPWDYPVARPSPPSPQGISCIMRVTPPAGTQAVRGEERLRRQGSRMSFSPVVQIRVSRKIFVPRGFPPVPPGERGSRANAG